jgi:hypothetical protein
MNNHRAAKADVLLGTLTLLVLFAEQEPFTKECA